MACARQATALGDRGGQLACRVAPTIRVSLIRDQSEWRVDLTRIDRSMHRSTNSTTSARTEDVYYPPGSTLEAWVLRPPEAEAAARDAGFEGELPPPPRVSVSMRAAWAEALAELEERNQKRGAAKLAAGVGGTLIVGGTAAALLCVVQ